MKVNLVQPSWVAEIQTTDQFTFFACGCRLFPKLRLGGHGSHPIQSSSPWCGTYADIYWHIHIHIYNVESSVQKSRHWNSRTKSKNRLHNHKLKVSHHTHKIHYHYSRNRTTGPLLQQRKNIPCQNLPVIDTKEPLIKAILPPYNNKLINCILRQPLSAVSGPTFLAFVLQNRNFPQTAVDPATIPTWKKTDIWNTRGR